VITDPATGDVVELHCTYDPDSLSKPNSAKRRNSTAIQWVSAAHAVPAEVRLYDRLFTVANPDEVEPGKSFKDYLNPKSVEILRGALVEPSLAETPAGERFQFMRQGFFIADQDSRPGALIFNRIVELATSYNWQEEGKPAAAPVKGAAPKPAPPEQFATGSVSEERVRARAESVQLMQRYEYYMGALGLALEQADVLTGDLAVAHFFDAALAVHDNPKGVANWIANEVLRELKGRTVDELAFDGADLGELVKLIDAKTISNAAAKTVFARMLAEGGHPREIVAALGLDEKMSEDDLLAIIRQVQDRLPDKVAEYRAGKTSLLGMFTGQVLKATGGKADPQQVQELLRQQLGE
jgi:glutaminyl-tRNA synthetase